MRYHHFTISERITIKSYQRLGISQTDIAKQLGVNKSSISRELKRNSNDDTYEPIKANTYYMERRKRCHKIIKLTPAIKQHIEDRISLTWSPDQIVHRKEEKPAGFPSSPATIYDWIHKGYLLEGDMGKLRRKGKMTKTIEEKKRCKLDIGKSIRKRPKIVYKRKTIGHWEGDTVMGKSSTKPCFATLLERKSRFYLANWLPNHTAEVVRDAFLDLLGNLPSKYVKTITFDRGGENSKWREIEKELKCKTYFTDPYCSCQKGSNENANGLLREFFPKGEDLSNITPEQVIRALYLINNRPRKCLNYRTPAEVFYEEILQSPKRL